MAGQDWLIMNVDRELEVELKRHNIYLHTPYEIFCRYLTLEDIFTVDSVYLTAKRCAVGFSKKNDTWNYQKNAWLNSVNLCQAVLNGSFKPKYYKSRSINERGKTRLIKPPSFECKVVQKVLCDYIIRPLLEPKMIRTSYASIKGRGTKKMYEDIEVALNKYRKKPNRYVIIQSDFSNYFGNIDTDLLIQKMLGRYIRDHRILNLIQAFSPEECGLSLGNEVSQIPASYFPSLFDHWCKDQNGWSYFRYMDDGLAILPVEQKETYIQGMFQYSSKLKITLKDEKIKMRNLGEPFIFCKERFLIDKNTGQYYRLMNPAIARKEKRKLEKFKEKKLEGLMTQEDIDLQYRGVLGTIASHPNTYHIREKLDSLYKMIE